MSWKWASRVFKGVLDSCDLADWADPKHGAANLKDLE